MNTENRLITSIPFCGFYCSIIDQFLDDYKDKPLSDWDYNELGVLFPAPENDFDLWEDSICDGFFYNVIDFNDEQED